MGVHAIASREQIGDVQRALGHVGLAYRDENRPA
jgi:hypothetical protein